MRHSCISRRRSLLIFAILLMMTSAVLVYTEHYSDIDLMLADYMFDPSARQFPWRHAWLTEKFGHGMLRKLFIALSMIPILLCVFDTIRPISSWSSWFRIRMRTVALSAVAVPLSVSTLKYFSDSHCPWNIDRYSGSAPYVRLLEALPEGVVPGHCFPAGHATSALWLISVATFWWPHRPRTAVAVGLAATATGFGVGWMQQMRGAHFLSHTLWSIWITCAIISAIFISSNYLGNRGLVSNVASNDKR